MKELFLEVLGKTLNLPIDEVAKLVFKHADDGTATDEIAENAKGAIEGAIANHISKVKTGDGGGKADFDKGHAAGKKEALDALEAKLKKDLGIQSDAKGIDLVKEAIAKSIASEMSEDKVKLHPAYLALEQRYASETAALEEKYRGEIDVVKLEYGRKERFNTAKDWISSVLDPMNPILPENPTAAKTWREKFYNEFSPYDFEGEGPDALLVLNGRRVENAYGHPLRLRDKVAEAAPNFFDFRKQDDKGAPGNRTPQAPTGAGQFKNLAEARQAYQSAPDAKARAALLPELERLEAAGSE